MIHITNISSWLVIFLSLIYFIFICHTEKIFTCRNANLFFSFLVSRKWFIFHIILHFGARSCHEPSYIEYRIPGALTVKGLLTKAEGNFAVSD